MNDKQVKEYFDSESEIYASETYSIAPSKEKYFRSISENVGRILDIGCGSGSRLVYLDDLVSSKEAHGIDISRKMINPENENGFFAVQGLATNLPYEDESFDIVHMENVLHHLVGATRESSKVRGLEALKEAARVLTEDGSFVLTERYFKGRLMSDRVVASLIFIILDIDPRILKLVDANAQKGLLVNFYTIKELQKVLCEIGFIMSKVEKQESTSGVPPLASPFLREMGAVHMFTKRKINKTD